MVTRNRFQRGSGVYTCSNCGKKTRETGHSESYVDLCATCYERGGDDNSVADGAITEAEFFERWGEHSTWWSPRITNKERLLKAFERGHIFAIGAQVYDSGHNYLFSTSDLARLKNEVAFSRIDAGGNPTWAANL